MRKISIILLISAFSSLYVFANDPAGFIIEIKGELNPYRIFSVFLMPNEEIKVRCDTPIILKSALVKCVHSTDLQWTIQAPEAPGVHPLKIANEGGGEMSINVMVLTPISKKKGEYLNSYRIGNYPIKPFKGNPIYNRPVGLFEVTKENMHILLTPHFKLEQFLCKQQSGFPKYLIIRERLLLKLEYLLDRLTEQGFEIETFGFISGYRTPYYNKLIQNVAYSRHVYGGAADIFIDQNNDGNMDDLNNDGIIDEKDVKVFYNIVESEFKKPSYDKYKGGLGFYKKNDVHSGFIHVDVRGWKARW